MIRGGLLLLSSGRFLPETPEACCDFAHASLTLRRIRRLAVELSSVGAVAMSRNWFVNDIHKGECDLLVSPPPL